MFYAHYSKMFHAHYLKMFKNIGKAFLSRNSSTFMTLCDQKLASTSSKILETTLQEMQITNLQHQYKTRF